MKRKEKVLDTRKYITLIECGKLSEALDMLEKESVSTYINKDVIKIKSRYKRLKKYEMQGDLAFDGFMVEENRIANSLIDLITSQEDNGKINVQLLIDGEIDDIDVAKKKVIIEAVSSILMIDEKNIKITRIISGSVKLIIKLSEEHGEKLIDLFDNNDSKLKELKEHIGVMSIDRVSILQERFELIEPIYIKNKYFSAKLVRSEYMALIQLQSLEINRLNAAFLKEEINKLKEKNIQKLIIDFNKVRQADHMGLGVIKDIILDWDNDRLVFINLRHKLMKEDFRKMNFDQTATILDNIESAYKYLIKKK